MICTITMWHTKESVASYGILKSVKRHDCHWAQAHSLSTTSLGHTVEAYNGAHGLCML